MQQEKLAEYQHALELRLKDIDVATAQAEAAADTVMLDQSSVGRLTRMDAMQQQAMAAEMRGRLETQKLGLKAALNRIAAGSYGLCCQCDVEMGTERLRGDPAAVFCADCTMERESHKTRNGLY
jgi:DnaK suppressor protein